MIAKTLFLYYNLFIIKFQTELSEWPTALDSSVHPRIIRSRKLTLAQGPENLDIPQCSRFPLHRERTRSAVGKDEEEDDRLVETKHEPRGKLQKTAPSLPLQACLLSKHCTFHLGVPEYREVGSERFPFLTMENT